MKSIKSQLTPHREDVKTFKSSPPAGSGGREISSRQHMLLGKENLDKRSGKTVLVVGAGTGGNPVINNLAEKGYNLVVCDHDTVSMSNLGHQGFSQEDLGKNKAERAAIRATRLTSRPITIVAVPMRFEDATSLKVKWMDNVHAVVVFTDNMISRFEVSLHYYLKIPVLAAGIEETNTMAWLFIQEPKGPCLRCKFPNIDYDSPDSTSCSGMSLDAARALSGYISFSIDTLFLDHKYRRRNWNYLKLSLDGFVSEERFMVEKNENCSLCSDKNGLSKE